MTMFKMSGTTGRKRTDRTAIAFAVRKGRSRRGAAMVFALWIFAVCTLAGFVALSAAASTAVRVRLLIEADQRYYSVSSAALLLRDLLQQQSVDPFVVVQRRTEDDGGLSLYTAELQSGPEGLMARMAQVGGTSIEHYFSEAAQCRTFLGDFVIQRICGLDLDDADPQTVLRQAWDLASDIEGETLPPVCLSCPQSNGEAFPDLDVWMVPRIGTVQSEETRDIFPLVFGLQIGGVDSGGAQDREDLRVVCPVYVSREEHAAEGEIVRTTTVWMDAASIRIERKP